MRHARVNPTYLLIAALLAALLGSAVATTDAHAARCKGGAKPAFKLSKRQAAKATLCLVNRVRSKKGLQPLRPARPQLRAAFRHSRHMVKKRCFAHRCDGEPDLVERMRRSDYIPCGCSWSVAENIAYGHGRKSSPRRVVRAWLGSRPHRENLLNPAFEHAGIGVIARAPSGHRRAATFTNTFGYRR